MIYELIIERLNDIYLQLMCEFKMYYMLEEKEDDQKKDDTIKTKSEVNMTTKSEQQKNSSEKDDDKTIISNDFHIKLKWLSKQFDKLYNMASTMFKKDIRFISINRQVSEIYELYSFFIENIDKYTKEEQKKIYDEFKNALSSLVDEIKLNIE